MTPSKKTFSRLGWWMPVREDGADGRWHHFREGGSRCGRFSEGRVYGNADERYRHDLPRQGEVCDECQRALAEGGA